MTSAAPLPERQSYQFEGIVTALSSISHIGETFGIESNLRREKIIQPDGRVEHVPVYSGNAFRGLLRDLGMAYMLREIGNPKLSLPAFYFLFSGGSLSKTAGKAIDIDFARKIAEMIPLVAVFGGAVGNQIMPGRLQIGKLIPICEETIHILPASARNGHINSIYECLQKEAYTRKDDEKDDRKRHLIDAGERKLIETKAAKKREVAGTVEDIDTEQHQQMRYYAETWAAGTRFHWRICLTDVTDLEFQSFLSCLVEFSRNPVIGGKGSIGHGRISVKFDKWLTIDPHITTGEAIDLPVGARYHNHLTEQRQTILDLLKEFE